jgi:signal transduction histidine kinase
MSPKHKLAVLLAFLALVSVALDLSLGSEEYLVSKALSTALVAGMVILAGWLGYRLLRSGRQSVILVEQSLRQLAAQGNATRLPTEGQDEATGLCEAFNLVLVKTEEDQQEIEKETKRLQAIQRITSLADFNFDPEKFSKEALKVILENLDLDYLAIYQAGIQDGQVNLKYRLGKEGTSQPMWEEISIWREAVQKAAHSNQIFLSQDQPESLQPKTEPDFFSKLKPAVMAIPLAQKGVVSGVLAGGTLRRAFFNPEELELLLSLSQHLTLNLENFRLYQDLREKVIEVTTFNRLGQALSSILEVDQLLKELLQIITTSFGYNVCAVLLYDHHRNELVSRALWGYPKEIEEQGVRLKIPGPGLCNIVIQEGEAVLSNDVESDPRYFRGWPGCRSELAVPLKSGDQVIGVLNVESEHPGAFTEKDIHLLTTLASQISILLQNARLFQEEKEKALQLVIADQINRAIASTLDLNLIFEIVHQGLSEFIRQDGIYFYFYKPEEHCFRRTYYFGNFESSQEDQLTRIPVANTNMWRVVKDKEVFVCNELQEGKYNKTIQSELYRMGIRSYVLVPIIDQEDVIGCFNIVSRQPNRFGKREIEICGLVANHLAVAIRNSRMYQELKEAYENLKNSQQTLIQSEKLRTLGEMTSGVVHDFNNLLATILGRTQILLQKIEGIDIPIKETCLKSLKAMEKAALDGSHLLNQISQFGKSKAELNLEPVLLNEVVADSLELTRPRWKNQSELEGIKIEVRTELNSASPISGDPAQLREVLMNLIINAIDALPKGGELFIQTGEAEEKVWLKIKDTGTGISPEIKDKIFDPFFTTKGKKGTGLGLPICLSIIRRLQGEIKADSQAGQGSTFTLVFPKLKEGQRGKDFEQRQAATHPVSVYLLR